MAEVYLAPLAGITDVAMREICIDYGASLTFTEMISAKGLSYKNQRTKELLALSPKETKVGVQLFGREAEILGAMAKEVEQALGERLYVIDINMGCPAPKITKNGEGVALMGDISLSSKLISAVRRSINCKLSVKFRKGLDEAHINAIEFGKMAEESGADSITIHGRTADMFYSGKADLHIIKRLKESLSIEVTGNGDIFTPKDALNMLNYTKCDNIMVARGAMGNPFIFFAIKELLQKGEVTTDFDISTRLATCLKQARIAIAQKGEYMAIRQMRTHASHYIKGIKHAASIRNEIVKIKTYADLERVFEGVVG